MLGVLGGHLRSREALGLCVAASLGAFTLPPAAAAARDLPWHCETDTDAFESAIEADTGLRELKSAVDEGWERLRSLYTGDPRRHLPRAKRQWLCDVEKKCGDQVALAHACLQRELQKRKRVNDQLISALSDRAKP